MTPDRLLQDIRAKQAVGESASDIGLDAVPVTPDDATDLVDGARSLVVGTAGALKVTTLAGSVRTYTGVPAGLFPVAVRRVWATGTTASNILAVL